MAKPAIMLVFSVVSNFTFTGLSVHLKVEKHIYLPLEHSSASSLFSKQMTFDNKQISKMNSVAALPDRN